MLDRLINEPTEQHWWTGLHPILERVSNCIGPRESLRPKPGLNVTTYNQPNASISRHDVEPALVADIDGTGTHAAL